MLNGDARPMVLGVGEPIMAGLSSDICYEKYGKKVPLLPREAPNMASQSSQAGIILQCPYGRHVRRRHPPPR